MIVSVLGPQGVPRPPYGAFSGKTSLRVTVLGPQGVPRPPYGAFSGKTPSAKPLVSVLGPQGVPRPPYDTALFPTKPVTPPPTTGEFTVSGWGVHDRFPVNDVVYTYAAITKRTN